LMVGGDVINWFFEISLKFVLKKFVVFLYPT